MRRLIKALLQLPVLDTYFTPPRGYYDDVILTATQIDHASKTIDFAMCIYHKFE